MLSFKPVDPKDIALKSLLPKGEYDFEVKHAMEKLSKASNQPMIEVKLVVFYGDRPVPITDYLVFTESGMGKLCGFCQATGLMDEYMAGSLSADDVIGRSGKLLLKVDEGNGEFEPKNAVARYRKVKDPVSTAPVSTGVKGDDVPF